MNKAILLIFTVSIGIFSSLRAQDIPNRFSMEVALGAAIPVGNFASKDTSYRPDESGSVAGWATVGPAVNISLDYQLTPNVGITLLAGGQQNKQNNEPTKKELEAIPTGGNNQYIIKKEFWKIAKIMVGGFVKTPISQTGRLDFRARIAAGVCKTAIPGFNFTMITFISNTQQVKAASSQKIPLPWSFCYQGNIGIQYAVTPRLSLVGAVDYFGARPVFNTMYYHYTPTSPIPENGVKVKRTYNLNTVSPDISASFSFK